MNYTNHMNKGIVFRIIYDSVVLVGILFVSWWYILFLCFVGVIIFQRYYECIFVGILLDMLYGIPREQLMSIPIIFTITTSILFIVSGGLKTHARFYE